MIRDNLRLFVGSQGSVTGTVQLRYITGSREVREGG